MATAAAGSSERTCLDLRTNVCDCGGAADELPACAAVVAELRMPPVVVLAMFGAAAVVTGGIVAAHMSFARCGKR